MGLYDAENLFQKVEKSTQRWDMLSAVGSWTFLGSIVSAASVVILNSINSIEQSPLAILGEIGLSIAAGAVSYKIIDVAEKKKKDIVREFSDREDMICINEQGQLVTKGHLLAAKLG